MTFDLFYAIIVNDMELLRSTSRRGFSVRGMLVFVLTVILTAFLWATIVPQITHAQAEPPAASWKGESILYAGHQHFEAIDAKAGNSLGFPEGTKYYVVLEEAANNTPFVKAYVISFKPGTDPPTAKTATYAIYTYQVSTKKYSNPQSQQTIEITPKGEESSYSSCSVEGVGWIICPLTVFMADSMDNIFKLVSQFFEVQPITSEAGKSDLYIAWNIMRSIANVAFIIVFLIIIYSQLSNAGVSNYGLKKLLPRLIVAAVLVNLSYIICSIAVDLSNILGYSLQDIFIQIRQNSFNITNDSWNAETTTWTGVTTFVLSAGTVGVIGVAAAGNLAGALPLLLPLLLGLVLTLLFVLLILAARQAIIIILIVIAPLAFVAYLLPNTEKWFGKWRELFMTMLIFFPAFSLIFGGSQLAGGLIIQNASSVFMIIFGLAIQVAPLVITPLLLRLSGGLLGKIAGIINDPRKGILDRSKNWANERAERNRLKSLGRPGLNLNPFRGVARALDNSSRRVKEQTSLYTALNDNRYNSTDKHAEIHANAHATHMEKDRIENSLNAHTQNRMNSRGSKLNIQAIRTENSKINLEAATETTNAMYSEYRAGGYDTGNNKQLARLQSVMASQVLEIAIEKQRQQSAQSVQVQQFAEKLKTDVNLQIKAGGIDEKGPQRALAAAISAQSKAHADAVANASSILSSFNYPDTLVNQIALNTVPAGKNLGFTLTSDIREAAVAKIAGGGNTNEIMKLVEHLDIANEDQGIRQTFGETLLGNSGRPKFVSAGFLADARQGNVDGPGKARLGNLIKLAVNTNKLGSAETLVTQDQEYLNAVAFALKNENLRQSMDEGSRTMLRKSIALAKTDSQYSGRIGERRTALDNIDALLSREIPAPDPSEFE